MRIGELAERVGVSTDTLRFYERSGWLPRPERRVNAYREYDENDVEHIRLLIDLRRLEIPLDDAEHAAEWAARQANRGALADLEDAADRGALAWSGYAAAARRLGKVEYVGGPRDGTTEERLSLPEELPGLGGRYARSVRCAHDGAMRYVWRRRT